MATATEKKILMPWEYVAAGEFLRRRIATWNLCLDAQIDDYPIGRRDRGKCRLQVERAKGKGYRTVRTTTDKRGIWCKPKKSVFHDGVIVVATEIPAEYGYDIQWLYATTRSINLGAASSGHHVLLEAPHYCKPSREAKTYTWRTTKLALTGTGLQSDGETAVEKQTIEADPPELCDAWDAWFEEYMKISTLLLETW